jgi:SAM-dependent methyltransferase
MANSLSEHAVSHLGAIRDHFDLDSRLSAQALSYREILARYYNLLIPPDSTVLEVGCGSGELLARLPGRRRCGVDLSEKQITLAREKVPDAEFFVQMAEELALPGRTFDCVVLSDAVNLAADVQQVFSQLRSVAHEKTRLFVNLHSTLWRPLVWLATALRIRRRYPACNWLSKADLQTLLELSGWEPIRFEARVICPVGLFGVERFLNRFVAPLVSPFCLVLFGVARVRPRVKRGQKSVSVVIPARNEAGNIERAVLRTPQIGLSTELILVEGHSTDKTWDEIVRVQKQYADRKIKIQRQTGKGKGNAVREGFDLAEGEILMILDADLTMPPEELPKFYDALVEGHCEFANGSRLVYPMDQKAMRFLNLCANKAFSVVFSWLLGQPVKDTLCGTKVLFRSDYRKIAENRNYFGEFDPFGDFDLLFGASKQNLKILDIPIRYKERTYGKTNIQRWRHGWLLLQMVAFALRKLKFV